jgi:protein-S-isoprenylcysteine O-methyltransferase Ste14
LEGEKEMRREEGGYRKGAGVLEVAILIALLFPILFFLLANFLVIPLEERDMKRIFKERFIEYKRRVRRWL